MLMHSSPLVKIRGLQLIQQHVDYQIGSSIDHMRRMHACMHVTCSMHIFDQLGLVCMVDQLGLACMVVRGVHIVAAQLPHCPCV